jgi:hypothetical protein
MSVFDDFDAAHVQDALAQAHGDETAALDILLNMAHCSASPSRSPPYSSSPSSSPAKRFVVVKLPEIEPNFESDVFVHGLMADLSLPENFEQHIEHHNGSHMWLGQLELGENACVRRVCS